MTLLNIHLYLEIQQRIDVYLGSLCFILHSFCRQLNQLLLCLSLFFCCTYCFMALCCSVSLFAWKRWKRKAVKITEFMAKLCCFFAFTIKEKCICLKRFQSLSFCSICKWKKKALRNKLYVLSSKCWLWCFSSLNYHFTTILWLLSVPVYLMFATLVGAKKREVCQTN